MRLGVIRFDGDRLHDEINGNVNFSRLMVDHTKQMQGDRVIGGSLQNLFTDIFCLRILTLSVPLHGEIQGVLEVQGVLVGRWIC